MSDYRERFRERFPQETIGHEHDERCEWECQLVPAILAFIDDEKIKSAEYGVRVGRAEEREKLARIVEGMMETGDSAKQNWVNGHDVLKALSSETAFVPINRKPKWNVSMQGAGVQEETECCKECEHRTPIGGILIKQVCENRDCPCHNPRTDQKIIKRFTPVKGTRYDTSTPRTEVSKCIHPHMIELGGLRGCPDCRADDSEVSQGKKHQVYCIGDDRGACVCEVRPPTT